MLRRLFSSTKLGLNVKCDRVCLLTSEGEREREKKEGEKVAEAAERASEPWWSILVHGQTVCYVARARRCRSLLQEIIRQRRRLRRQAAVELFGDTW